MVRGRRGKQFIVELDLGHFGDVGVDDADHPHEDEPSGVAPARAGARRARVVLAASLAAFLSLSAWGATTETAAHRRLAALLEAPGGAVSLAAPASAAWAVEADLSHAPVSMPGLLVVQRGAELHAMDVGTGTERWQVEVGASAVCGPTPSGLGGAAVVNPLVCVATEAGGRQTVTVVQTNGAAVSRVLDEGAAAAAVTAAGDVVTVRRTGPATPPPDAHVRSVPGGGYAVEGSVAAGQDVVVRLEDAKTGAPRWERALTFSPVVDAGSCGTVVRGSNDQPTYDASSLAITTPSSLVDVRGCGIEGTFTAGGETVELPSPHTSQTWLEPYADGGVIRHDFSADGRQTTMLVQPDGGRTEFAGQVLSPLAADGTRPDIVLVATNEQSFQACDRQGVPLWVNTLPVASVLARASHVAVVALSTDGTVAGVDLKTGTTLWVDPPSFLESTSTTRDRTPTATDLGTSSDLAARAAFTDGTRVAVAVEGTDGTTRGLVTLDPATGDVRWRSLTTSSESVWTQYVGVAGHVFSMSVAITGADATPTTGTITAWH